MYFDTDGKAKLFYFIAPVQLLAAHGRLVQLEHESRRRVEAGLEPDPAASGPAFEKCARTRNT